MALLKLGGLQPPPFSESGSGPQFSPTGGSPNRLGGSPLFSARNSRRASLLKSLSRPPADIESEDSSEEGARDRTTKKQALGGDDSALQDLILSCNQSGMEALRNDDNEAAFEKFKYAEAMLLPRHKDSDDSAMLAVTCNNLGCYYKKVGKLHGALSYLRKALKMEVNLQTDSVTVAGTHLNLCAVLSRLQKHDKALQHALCALQLMSDHMTESRMAVSEDDYSLLAIAYHNVGMEREFQGQWDQAVTSFQKGHQVASRLLGESHPLSVTLEQHFEATLRKATQSAKLKLAPAAQFARQGASGHAAKEPLRGRDGDGIQLPALPHTAQEPASKPMAPARGVGIRNDAAAWVLEEEAAWDSFAKKMLGDDVGMVQRKAATRVVEAPTEPSSLDAKARGGSPAVAASALAADVPVGPKPLTAQALRGINAMKEHALQTPTAYDMGLFRLADVNKGATGAILKNTPVAQALDDHPTALMDIIDTTGEAKTLARLGTTDCRPNRSMHRSTRTTRMVSRSGVFNSTAHRDQVAVNLAKRREANFGATVYTSAAVQKLAAERIQSVWRSWHRYCQENAEWMTITWICATMIQTYWRSYHVRRQRWDKHARIIQRHIRGTLVRNVLKKHSAAVTIQRHAVGMITRGKVLRLHYAAIEIQRLTRGGLARKRFRKMRAWKLGIIITIQSGFRLRAARQKVEPMREEARCQAVREKAAVDMQRFFRGWKGRQKASRIRDERRQREKGFGATVMIQLFLRRRIAKRRTNELRLKRLQEMDAAATFVRKMWVAQQSRKRYKNLVSDYKSKTPEIVTIQRCLRGCLCRLKLWREAVRAEEELWATLTIQRYWRGYLGRVDWETAYEHMWRREIRAALVQRNVRGWLARVRVNRMRRSLARAEFQRAHQRYQASQRIQALVRGVQVRGVTRARHQRAKGAAIAIQRIARGHALRSRLWQQIETQNAIAIQATMRGVMVRNRRFHLLAKVVLIQRNYRLWLTCPKSHREKLVKDRKQWLEKATIVQRAFREFRSNKELKRIKGREA